MALREIILSGVIQVLIDRFASKEVLSFFKSSKLDQSLVNKLKNQMFAARRVLADAEQKQSTDSSVKSWLEEFEAVFYQAQEIADKIAAEDLQSYIYQSTEPKSFKAKVRNWIPGFSSSSSFASSISNELTEVVAQLEHMVSLSVALGLKDVSPDTTFTRLPMTSLTFEGTQVVSGRNKEMELLFNSLLSEKGERSRIDVVTIVGKTTLAKHVKVWVYVPHQGDNYQLTKSFLERITCQSYSSSFDLEFLQRELIGKLRNKKYFVVLDDVWSEKPEELYIRHVFEMIVTRLTTRNDKVANIMHETPVFCLEGLSVEDWRSLLPKHAFAIENSQSDPPIGSIGRKIIHRRQGLSLTIKTLGDLLQSKEDTNEWEAFLPSTSKKGVSVRLQMEEEKKRKLEEEEFELEKSGVAKRKRKGIAIKSTTPSVHLEDHGEPVPPVVSSPANLDLASLHRKHDALAKKVADIGDWFVDFRSETLADIRHIEEVIKQTFDQVAAQFIPRAP